MRTPRKLVLYAQIDAPPGRGALDRARDDFVELLLGPLAGVLPTDPQTGKPVVKPDGVGDADDWSQTMRVPLSVLKELAGGQGFSERFDEAAAAGGFVSMAVVWHNNLVRQVAEDEVVELGPSAEVTVWIGDPANLGATLDDMPNILTRAINARPTQTRTVPAALRAKGAPASVPCRIGNHGVRVFEPVLPIRTYPDGHVAPAEEEPAV